MDNSNGSQRAKRHHYIPQFWIKRWADSDGLVKRYRRFDSNVDVIAVPPKSVGYFRNLYDLPRGLRRDKSLEELFFKPLDDRVSKVFQVIDSGSNLSLSGEDAGSLAVFILSLLHRTPDGLTIIKEAANLEYVRALEDLRSNFDAAKVRKFEESQPVNAAEIAFYRSFIRLMTNERLIEFIARMHWRILYREKGTHPLLLSDDPIARTNGFRRPEGHFAFPLSPEKLIIAFYDEAVASESVKRSSKDMFEELNRQTVGAARHFVVANSESNTRFIANRFGRALRPPFGKQILEGYSKRPAD